MKRITYLFSALTTLLTLASTLIFPSSLTAQEPIQVSFGDLRARAIGPAVMSGRISDIDGVHSNPKIIYIAAAGGGVWKSTSGGSSFRPVFDEHTQSIGHIAIDQQHPDTVWVGTGEPWVRNSVSVGDGIYVSTNGGTTWTHKGLKASEHIADVIVHPTNSSTVFVAVQGQLWSANPERGVYKTTDFGTTWEKVLYIDENTGCADLAMDPENPNILYAAMWDHRRSPDFFRSGGPGSGLYKSTDGGATWTELRNGLPEGMLGRMAVEIAPSDPNVVYLSVESEKSEQKGIYRSNDAGANWELTNIDFNSKVRPFYFSRLVVDPTNPDKVFKCGLNLTISEDGGKTFRTVGSGVHSDIHAIWVNPQNADIVYIGTDGGGYRSLDGGYLFEMFMDLPISQFYHVSVDDAKPFNVYGGLQDNGSWYGPSASPGGVENKDWRFSNWGDGFYSFRHPTDPNIVYSESQGGNLVRVNLADGQKKDIKPLPAEGEPDYRFNWNAPIHISPNNPERLYFGAQFLFKTEDRGNNWERISPDLSTNDPQRQRQKKSGGLSIDNSGAENNTTIYAIAESPANENIIWVGTDDGNLQVTTDAGANWTNVVGNINGLPSGLWCTWVEPSRYDPQTCYVTFDGHRSGDKIPYVFRTSDGGKTWVSLATEDLTGYCHVIREDVEAKDLLYLGTEFGLFVSLDGGLSWKRFDNNVPKVGVRAIAIQPRDHALVLGTHGRGIYIIDNINLLRQITPEILDQKLAFLDSGPTYIMLSQPGEPFGGSGNFTGQNPDQSVKIAYYMKRRHTFGRMGMKLYDQDGNLLREFPAGKSGGMNLVTIPVQLPMPKAAPTGNRMALFGSIIPPSLAEGTYTVEINKGKETFTTNFDLEFDPDAAETYPEEDRKASHALQMQLYNMTNRLGYIYYQSKTIEESLTDETIGNLKKKWAKEARTLRQQVADFKNSLVSLEGDGYVNEGESLREKISQLYLGISGYPGKPSSRQVDRAGQLLAELDEAQATYDNLVEQLDAINEQLERAELKPIALQTMEDYLK
jgi:photosystem II stability/assembly factor-like uncharacterized protein